MINSEEKNRLSGLEIMKSIEWQSIVLCAMGFIIGRVCLFNTFYTLGIAYLGSMYFDKQIRRWATGLTVVGILSVAFISMRTLFDTNMVRYLLIIGLFIGFRMAMVMFKVEFNLKNQMVLMSGSMLLINLMNVALTQFTMYKFVIAVLEVVVALGLMQVLSMAISHIYEKKKTVLTEYELASMAFLIGCLLFGLIDMNIVLPLVGKIYLKDALTFVILIGATYLGGMSGATVVSIIVSAVLVVLGYIPTSFVALYVFAAMIGGLFAHLERIGIIFATAMGLLLGFALFNDRVIDGTIMGAYMIAAIISLGIPKNYFGMVNWFSKNAVREDEIHQIANVQTIMIEKLKHFSRAFDYLGRQFGKLPIGQTELDIAQMNSIIEETGESMCKDCSMCNFCWQDYLQATYQYSYNILAAIDAKGQIMAGDIPEGFRKSCVNAESFAYTLGLKLDVFRQECRWKKNFQEARGLLAEEFKGISESVQKLSEQIQGDFSFNTEDEEVIRQELQKLGVRTRDVMVLQNEGRRQEVHLCCTYRGEADYKEKVLIGISKALGVAVEIRKYEYHESEKYCYFVLGMKKQFSVMASARNQALDQICGDSYSFSELDNGKYVVALADGMGSGVAAARESAAAIELLENFLEAGFESEVALRMINSAMVLRSDIESYATMDLALIDQYTGVVEFFKMGASTSFILRGDEVLSVKASSLPIGILSQVDVVSFKKQLKDGDILIMVTDGILEDKNDLSDRETTFKHFIMESKSVNPDHMASYLLSKTKNLLAGEVNDDMTIAVARIWK